MAKQVNSAWAAIQNGSFDRLAEGLCVFDRAHKLVAWNDVFRQLLKLPRKLLRRGVTLERVVTYAVKRGDFDQKQGDRLIASWTRETLKPGKKVAGWPREDRRPLTTMRRRAENGQVLFIIKQSHAEDADAGSAEEALSRQAAALEQISEGVLISAGDGTIIDCNPSACRIFGYDKDALIGMNAYGLVTPEVEESGLATTIETDVSADQAWFGETDVQRSDGTTCRVDASVLPRRDASGAIVGRIGVVRDITEQRAADEARLNSDRKFRDLIEGSLQGFIIYAGGRVLYVNKAAADTYGYEPSEMIGLEANALAAEEEHATLDELRELANTGRQILRGKRKDGRIVWLELNARAITWEGQAARQVTIYDITERRDAEDALLQAQKMESLGQLTGGIAHDFNNLLGVISGNLELLRDQSEDGDPQHSFIETGLRSVRRGAELTQRLLAFARKQPLRPEYTDLSDLVRDMKALLQRTLGERFQVKTILADKAWPTLVDQGQMENVLLNLALNARDAMPKGGRLLIRTENVALEEEITNDGATIAPGDYLKVTVKDTGTGMTPEVLANAFDPFFTTKGSGSGSGLGLSMVYGFVSQSSGHIRIDSTVGKGTAIELFLPRTFAEARAKTSQDKTASPRGNNEVVLVVEDDDDLRELAVLLLDRMGYKTYQAADGHSAVALMRKVDHLDLVFTDVVLPYGMSGIDAAREARTLFPAIKILFTSGYTESEVLGKELEKGNVEMITKPYRTDVLARRLQEVLAG